MFHWTHVPIGCMYDIFTYIYPTNQPNVGKTTHTWILCGRKIPFGSSGSQIFQLSWKVWPRAGGNMRRSLLRRWGFFGGKDGWKTKQIRPKQTKNTGFGMLAIWLMFLVDVWKYFLFNSPKLFRDCFVQGIWVRFLWEWQYQVEGFKKYVYMTCLVLLRRVSCCFFL